MPIPSALTDKPIYTIVEEDIQTVARDSLHRDLTPDELQYACRAFANGMNWWDVAQTAIDLAVEHDA
jgi:hypothetical protein